MLEMYKYDFVFHCEIHPKNSPVLPKTLQAHFVYVVFSVILTLSFANRYIGNRNLKVAKKETKKVDQKLK